MSKDSILVGKIRCKDSIIDLDRLN